MSRQDIRVLLEMYRNRLLLLQNKVQTAAEEGEAKVLAGLCTQDEVFENLSEIESEVEEIEECINVLNSF
jgi:hypothetical protein